MERAPRTSFLLAAGLAFAAVFGVANRPSDLRSQTRTDASAPRSAERVDALARALVETAGLPSLSIAILREGEVAYARAFGYADLEARRPATPDTRYRCASVSKIITATAVGRLAQDGRLDLDAPVATYVPSWPAEPAITPRQLAGHLAGVSHYRGEDRIERSRHYESVTASLDVFRDSHRSGAPGETYTYSTHGFTLLSAVAEGAGGRDFLDLLEREVFVPLGMESTGPDLRASPHLEMSTLYGRRGGEPFRIPNPEDPSYKWGAGGLVSTPTDLVRLAAGYLGDYLSDDIVEEMWTPQRTNDGEEIGVGIAWRIGEDGAGRRILHHSGAMGGARTTLVLRPARREAIAVMSNVVWTSAIMETGLALLDAFGADSEEAAPAGTGGEVVYVGEFARNDEVAATEGRLRLEDGSGWITTPDPFAAWTGEMTVGRMPIHHLADERYLLVSPYGLMPLALAREGNGWRGTMEIGSIRWRFHVAADGP